MICTLTSILQFSNKNDCQLSHTYSGYIRRVIGKNTREYAELFEKVEISKGWPLGYRLDVVLLELKDNHLRRHYRTWLIYL